MREHNIVIDGKHHKVKLLKVDKRASFLLQVDNSQYKVQLRNELSYGTSVSMRANGKSYNVELEKISKSTAFFVKVNGVPYRAQYKGTSTAYQPSPKPISPRHSRTLVMKSVSEKGSVTSALPGKVVSLKVRAGDSVEIGDTLCVLEAMKMENEITAPVAGIVEKIAVSEGDVVNKGQALVMIR